MALIVTIPYPTFLHTVSSQDCGYVVTKGKRKRERRRYGKMGKQYNAMIGPIFLVITPKLFFAVN